MPIVHAYRRKKPHTVELRGDHFKFAANEAGAQVCEVPAGPALERLLEIEEGYKLYNVEKQVEAEDDDAPLSPFIITIGDNDETVDLRTIKKKTELIEFASANELKIDPTLKVDDYRLEIVKALTSAG